MTFGNTKKDQTSNPVLNTPTAPTPANTSVLLAGLMGLAPKPNAALSTAFASGSTSGLGRRPALAKRISIGGA